MKITTVAALFLFVACGGNKSAAPEGTPESAAELDRDTARAGLAGLCIDPRNIQIEPLDLEALDDELPPVPPGSALAELLDGLTEHGSPVALAGGERVVPFVRCSDTACEAGVMTVDAGGKERSVTHLPGLDRTLPAGTRLELVTARADVNSDGEPDLWVGYRMGDPESSPSTQHMAAFALPAVELQWHGVISQSSPAADEPGCEGVLYPVDADCDGDGDLVLAQRCGPMRCLSDDSERCAGVEIEDRISAYLWDPKAGRYSARR
jgi:hypothetical protein